MATSKKTVLSFLFTLLLSLPAICFALILQQDYPEVTGITLTASTTLQDLGRYFYYFFIMIGGVVAFWGLVMGGLKWLTSAGNPGRLGEAKNQIIASFLGIIILLSSWVILHTLDPSLITFHAFPVSVTIPALPTTMGATEMEHGYILYIEATPPLDPIYVPGGNLQVEDTERFPVGGTTLHLGGPPAHSTAYLREIEFLNPVGVDIVCDRDADGNIIPGTCCMRDRDGNIVPDHCCDVNPDTEEIIPGSCDTYSYYYGVICFSEPHYQGEAMVITSYQNPGPRSLTWSDAHGNPRYCRSLYSFRQPSISIYSRGDQIIFYEDHFPIEKDPETGAVIGRACIKVDTDAAPEDCHVHPSLLQQDYTTENGIFEISCLRGFTEDENGNIINLNGWAPLSMDLSVDRDKKYLIILYQGGLGGEHCQERFGDGPFTGNALKIDRDVPDFSDPKDTRLWWVRSGLDPYPHSAQILPLEPIE